MNAYTLSDLGTSGGDEPALLVGRYRIVRQLGQGGMGSVLLAEDTQLENHQVAIKTLPAIIAVNPRALRQLKQEALVSLKLSHPNICTLRSFEENNGNPFLVMDYIDGVTLDSILGEKGLLDEAEAKRLLAPVAAALDYAHAHGVVHRDIKPGNVMVAKDGTPYVLDFGIAREIQETMTRVTGNSSSGTLMYMSPEQLNGARPKSPQDVYSFAAMIYECLTGEPPFCRGQIEYQIVNNPPEPLPDTISDVLSQSILAGLAKNPADRPATCAAVLGYGGGESSLSGGLHSCATASFDSSLVGSRVPRDRTSTSVYLLEEEARALNEQLDTRINLGTDAEIDASVAAARLLHRAATNAFQHGDRGEAIDLFAQFIEKAKSALAAEEERMKNVVSKRQAGTEKTLTLTGGVEMSFVWCPAGEFVMGGPWDRHRVRLTKGFWIGKYPVTQEQWKSVMGKECKPRFTGDDLPMESVSWDDCQEFCQKVGNGIRLPTESEWEYACRAGTSDNHVGNLDERAWYCNNSSRKTHPVGMKKPNNWGVCDMLGNVWEWCQDWYGDYPEDEVIDPMGPPLGEDRVIRGGGWNNGPGGCSAEYRGEDNPSCRDDPIGFRLVCPQD